MEQTTLHSVLDKYCSVFDNELGCMKGIEVELQTKPSAKPRFLKPRSVPYILKQKVEKELLRLESLGIISPVKTSKWAAPIVPVMKKNGSVRVCGDFKTTFNQVSVTESYPLPRIEELFSNLKGGKYFTKFRAFPNALLSGAAPRSSNYTKNTFFNKKFLITSD